MSKKEFVINVNECGEFTSLGEVYVFSTEKPDDVPVIAKLAYDKYKSLRKTSPQMVPSVCVCIDDWDYEVISGGRITDTSRYPKEIIEAEQFISLRQALSELIRKDV